VTYYDRAIGAERQIEGAAVVLAAGALASTKLLFDSTSPDFPAGLGNSEGLLGKYLHDHVHDMCVIETDRPLTRLRSPAYFTRAGYGQTRPLLTAAASFSNRRSKLDRLLNFTPLATRRFGVIIFGTMVPLATNYVRPDPVAKDELGLPALDVHIRYQRDEIENAAQVKQDTIRMLEATGYASRVAWSLPEATPGTSVHYGGTVRMHTSPEYGMLDGWNRLHAVPNVLVVDASCFTTGVEKNPTLTAMALASRAAGRLAKDLQGVPAARAGERA
jgi:choline dehydrogenase-like flavoprotein